jgi:hypothetical protein
LEKGVIKLDFYEKGNINQDPSDFLKITWKKEQGVSRGLAGEQGSTV